VGGRGGEEEEEEEEEEATHTSLSFSPLPSPPSITHDHRRGHSRCGTTPGRDPAGAAWLGIALAMACGVRPTRGGVEPKERWL
jgi:hypothetical protein